MDSNKNKGSKSQEKDLVCLSNFLQFLQVFDQIVRILRIRIRNTASI
jgi:hypothetical protein